MAKEKLDSDKINYMIWRYLIELGKQAEWVTISITEGRACFQLSTNRNIYCLIPTNLEFPVIDYCETAIRLQKEWNMEDPQQLSFAPYVQSRALVSILNRGLIYNMHERGFAAQEHHDSSADTIAAQKLATTGFFGPVIPPSPTSDDEFTVARKHLTVREPAPSSVAPPAKKLRLSNGFPHGQALEDKTCSATVLKIGDNNLEQNAEEGHVNGDSDEHAYPSPEQMPTPRAIITSGPEQGMQVEQVHDLTSDTIFLELIDRPTIKGAILAHCAFHPRDSNVLAAAGSDALARIWSLKSLQITPVESATESPDKPIYAPHRDLHDQSMPVTTQATALSWSPQGHFLAIASQPSDTGLARVDFWNEDASLVSSHCGIDPPVLDIQWNPSGTACLVISPRNDANDASIAAIYPALGMVVRHTLANHNLVEQLLEVVWKSNDDFIVCGGNLLQTFISSPKSNIMTPGRKYEVPEGVALSQVVFDPETQLLATASDTGMIYIWDSDANLRVFNAHQGLITLLVWQPTLATNASSNHSERLLASAGDDGAISIWNALSDDMKSRASMTMRSGVSAMAFSPDGMFLAGATCENIIIWHSNNPHIPRAIWNRQYELGWQSPLSSESASPGGEEDICSLSWNCEGKMLAYGINNRLAVIGFQP